jgi:glycosyltransferase involved in cell wall biosynthesis
MTEASTPTCGVLPISVIVMTKNKEAAITDCLASVASFPQIFVVDSTSAGRTSELARSLGATVFAFDWNGGYPRKKQWCLENLPFDHPFVLFVDADEQVTPALLVELNRLDWSRASSAYDIPLDYVSSVVVFLGRRLRYGHKVFKRALLRLGAAAFPVIDDLGRAENMWEVEGHCQPTVAGPIGTLQSPCYTKTARRYFTISIGITVTRIGRRLLAHDISTGPKAMPRTRNGQIFSHLPLKSLAFFVYAFVVKKGYRDGRAGFTYAIAHVFYYWQISVKTFEICERDPTSSTPTLRQVYDSS